MPSFLPADESRLSVCRASVRARTAVTFSGIIRDSAILIEIPGKIRSAPWKSVPSVQCVSRRPSRRAALFYSSRVASGSNTATLLLRRFKNNDIVTRYVIKVPLPPYQTVHGAFSTGCECLVINTAVKTDLCVRGIWPGVSHKSCQGNCANWPS